MRLWDRLKLLRLYIGLVRNPQRTDLIFKAVEISTRYKKDPLVIDVLAHVMDLPGFHELYEERYLPPWPTLDELRASPAASFGEALYRHLADNNLDLELFPRIDPQDPLGYLNARAYQDHDLWHALFGYGTSIEDELALQAFTVAQIGTPLGALIISGGLLHLILRQPLRAAAALAKIAEGYHLGQRTRFLLGLRLVDMLPQPITEVRAAVCADIKAG